MYLVPAAAVEMSLFSSGSEELINLTLLLRWNFSIKNAENGRCSEVVFF